MFYYVDDWFIFWAISLDILLIWAVFPIIRKNLIQFSKKQIKRETFSISIKNLIVFNGAYALCLLLGLFF